jgi:diguanylate cyclase (GGDEF)-like protein
MPDHNQQPDHSSNTWITAVMGKGLLALILLLWILAGIYLYTQVRADINIFSLIVIAILLFFITGLSIYYRNLRNELGRVQRVVDQVASTDELTQLFNRKHFLGLFEKELGRATRHNRKICCLIVDIDHFKEINEKYGAKFGDGVLRNVADILRDNLRISDLVGRYESNKFICVLPETDVESSMILSKRMRSLVEGTNFSDDKTGEIINITISIGVSCLIPEKDKDVDILKMISVAEKALTAAKDSGRNRVESSLV